MYVDNGAARRTLWERWAEHTPTDTNMLETHGVIMLPVRCMCTCAHVCLPCVSLSVSEPGSSHANLWWHLTSSEMQHCWQRLCPTPISLCPVARPADKKPSSSLLWCYGRFTPHSSFLSGGTLTLAPPSNHEKIPGQSPSPVLSRHFGGIWELPCSPPKASSQEYQLAPALAACVWLITLDIQTQLWVGVCPVSPVWLHHSDTWKVLTS